MKKEVLKFKEVQEVLGTGKCYTLDLFNSKDFPGFKLAGKWCIRYDSLMEYLRKLEAGEVCGI